MSYEISAPIYDAIYEAMKDYAAEAARVADIIRVNQRSVGSTLLDVGCGTGLHSQYLRGHFDVHGVDASPAQLSVAAERLPNVPLSIGYMQDFDLDIRADAIVCLFSAIGHLATIDELFATIANFERQLKPGGVIVIEPWIQPQMWHPGYFGLDTVDTPDLKIARIGRSTRTENTIHVELEHLVGRPEGNQHFIETHDLTMFTEAEFGEAFAAARLDWTFDPKGINPRARAGGRGVYIATKSLV